MSNYKIEFTLKQHTPIIHFQSDQSGATLRATELKPKFDRFLKKYAFNDNFETYKIFLIGYDEEKKQTKKDFEGKEAFDYKVIIEQNLSPAIAINSRESLFFGNMGDVNDKKYKQHTNQFKIKFVSFRPTLVTTIKNHFEAFLANTNFGTRQSKGYGSFYLDKPFEKSLIPYKVYSFNTNNWQRDIGLLYQFLRQGINIPRNNNPFYTKPAIFAYAKSKNWQWDKKAIKQTYFTNQLEQQYDEHNPSDVLEYSSNEKYILRDMFGLSSSQEWQSYGKTIEKVGLREEEVNGVKIVAIQRFKSPVTFKVVEGNVYFWANDTVEKVLGEEFKIKAGTENESLSLSFPTEFSFEDFFDFTFTRLNLSTHIHTNFHNLNEYTTLVSIFEKIKANA